MCVCVCVCMCAFMCVVRPAEFKQALQATHTCVCMHVRVCVCVCVCSFYTGRQHISWGRSSSYVLCVRINAHTCTNIQMRAAPTQEGNTSPGGGRAAGGTGVSFGTNR